MKRKEIFNLKGYVYNTGRIEVETESVFKIDKEITKLMNDTCRVLEKKLEEELKKLEVDKNE